MLVQIENTPHSRRLHIAIALKTNPQSIVDAVIKYFNGAELKLDERTGISFPEIERRVLGYSQRELDRRVGAPSSFSYFFIKAPEVSLAPVILLKTIKETYIRLKITGRRDIGNTLSFYPLREDIEERLKSFADEKVHGLYLTKD